MKKRNLILVMLSLLLICGCTKKEIKPVDDDKPHGCDGSDNCEIFPGEDTSKGKNFKEAYEALNDTETASGKTYRTIEIEQPNGFVMITPEELDKLISDPGFSGIILASDPKCPWCRSVLPYAVKVANEMKMGTIYVIHVWDEQGTEVWRDKFKLEDGEPVKIAEGHPTYFKMLEMDDGVLSNYSFSDADGNPLDLGEKRIYAPNFMCIKNGKIVSLEEGSPASLTDPYMEITDTIASEITEIMKSWFTEVKAILEN